MQAGHNRLAFYRIERLTAVRAVRSGLINMIPVLTIGAFALILQTFPVPAYQNAIHAFGGGILLELFQLVYSGTFGVLSVYMTISISRAYMKIKADPVAVNTGASFASLLSFFIFAGAYLPDFDTGSIGPKAMFMAIITGLGASRIYISVNKLFARALSVFDGR